MKYIIAGRVGSGKTTLAKCLEAKGLRLAKSYTTRPKREDEGSDYFFITKEEAEHFSPAERVVATHRQEYDYFMSREEVLQSDIFIVDPNGVRDLLREFPEEEFKFIYVRPVSTELAQSMHDARDPGGRSFAERSAAEDAMFTEFERGFMYKEFRTKFSRFYNIVNGYDASLANWADCLMED